MKNLLSNLGFEWWIGVVENRHDPAKLGRCQIRIFGYHIPDSAALPTEDLPWAIPMLPSTSAAISGIGHSPTGLIEGSWVLGFFLDGAKAQEPVILGSLPGIDGKFSDTLGFNDPSGVYPRDSGSVVAPRASGPIVSSEYNTQAASDSQTSTDSEGKPPAGSTRLYDFIRAKEGWHEPLADGRAKAYWDYGQHSIGYGTKANSPDEIIDKTEGERRLRVEVDKWKTYVENYNKNKNYGWNETQIDALTSFCYNLGYRLDQLTESGNRSNDTIRRKMLLYNKVNEGGRLVENRGLTARRREESNWFASGMN